MQCRGETSQNTPKKTMKIVKHKSREKESLHVQDHNLDQMVPPSSQYLYGVGNHGLDVFIIDKYLQ